MELVKREDHWALYNEDGHKIAATIPGCKSKLSIKNCQAIENGYDLDELAEKYFLQNYSWTGVDHLPYKEEDVRLIKENFVAGAKAILELLGDKKFTQENMIDAMITTQVSDSIHTNQDRLDFIQSLQQTEWDVEIVTKPYTVVSEGFNLESKREPKLDADGYLILKRL